MENEQPMFSETKCLRWFFSSKRQGIDELGVIFCYCVLGDGRGKIAWSNECGLSVPLGIMENDSYWIFHFIENCKVDIAYNLLYGSIGLTVYIFTTSFQMYNLFLGIYGILLGKNYYRYALVLL